MAASTPKKNRLQSLLDTKPVAIQDSTGLVDILPAHPGSSYPVTIQARAEVNLAAWLESNKTVVAETLRKNGAVLFRQFDVETNAAFQQCTAALSDRPMMYSDRSSPRTQVDNALYTSTDHPPDQFIHMHSELSYSHNWPMQILFYCRQPAESGGETPIADTRTVLALLPREVQEEFEAKGILYLRNLVDEVGLSWREVYQTDSKEEIEHMCRANHIDLTWKSDKHLTISWQRPAIRRHPVTGEQVWFNHGLFFNTFSLEPAIRRVLEEQDMIPFQTAFGDGTPIPVATLEAIREAYTKALAAFRWQRKDVLLLDNMLMAHGRNAYTGKRSILVAMCEPHG